MFFNRIAKTCLTVKNEPVGLKIQGSGLSSSNLSLVLRGKTLASRWVEAIESQQTNCS